MIASRQSRELLLDSRDSILPEKILDSNRRPAGMPYQTNNKNPSILDGMTNDGGTDYEKLMNIVKTHAKDDTKTQKAPRITVITDLAKDYDDLAAMVCLKELHRLRAIKLQGFIANLMPVEKRRLCTRDSLDSLGHILRTAPPMAGFLGAKRSYHRYEPRLPTAEIRPSKVTGLAGAMEAKSPRTGAWKHLGAELTALQSLALGEADHTCPSSPPIRQYVQTPPPPDLQSSVEHPPSRSDDGGIPPTNTPQLNHPPILSEPEVGLYDRSSREADEPPPLDEGLGGGETQSREPGRPPSMFYVPLSGIAVFLGPINIVSGMTASHGDNWKLAFVGFFVLWLVVGTIWLFLDLREFQRSSLTKRCLWHLAGCAAALYFFMAILQIISDNLPQWLPTIVDCGVGISLGFQSIPASARSRVGQAISSVIVSVFGGTQVIVRTDEEHLLQRV